MDSAKKVDTSKIKRLVEESQAGDRRAFDQLVRLYQRRAMQVAVGISGNVNEAAEAVQVAFVKAYLSIEKLKEPGRFEVWLLRIVANAAISQRRKADRRSQEIDADRYNDSREPSPLDKEIARELKKAIAQAMLKLSDKEAKAISLFGLKDLSHKETAEIMGCSVQTARWFVFEARRKLKVLLKEHLE